MNRVAEEKYSIIPHNPLKIFQVAEIVREDPIAYPFFIFIYKIINPR